MRFSAEQALEAHEEGEPIVISRAAANKIISEHTATPTDFWNEVQVDRRSHHT
jgi:hypothetical protein